MVTVLELKEWLEESDPDVGVYIDEGGLTLKTEEGNWFEIGGEPCENE